MSDHTIVIIWVMTRTLNFQRNADLSPPAPAQPSSRLSLPLNIRAQREEDEIQPVVAGCRARKTTGQETAAWWRPLNSSEWGRGHEGIGPERALPSSHARGRGSSQRRREKQLLIEILDL